MSQASKNTPKNARFEPNSPENRYRTPINEARCHSNPVIPCDDRGNPAGTPLPNMVGIQCYSNNDLYIPAPDLPCIYIPVPEGNEILHDNRMNNIGGPIVPVAGDEYTGYDHKNNIVHYFTYAQIKTASYALNAMWGERCIPPHTNTPIFKYVGYNCAMSGHPDYTSCIHQISAQYTNRAHSNFNVTTHGRGADGERIFAKCLNPSINTSDVDELLLQNCKRARKINSSAFTTKLRDMELVRFEDCIGDFVIRRNHTMIEVKFIKDLVYHLESSLGRFICTIYCAEFKLQNEHFTLGVFCSCDQNVFTQLIFGYKAVLITNFYRITESIAEFINNHNIKDAFELAEEATKYTSEIYSEEVRQHAKRIIVKSHHEIYQRNRNSKLNGYIATGNVLYTNDVRRANRQNDNKQYIGYVGYEIEDFTYYLPTLMSFRLVKVDGSSVEDRVRAYKQGIRLIIQRVPDDQTLSFDHHYDVSVLYLPQRLMDFDIMFMINNCLWSSIHEICHNIARNTFHNKLGLYEYNDDKPQLQRLEALDQCFYVTVLPQLEHIFRPFAREHRYPRNN